MVIINQHPHRLQTSTLEAFKTICNYFIILEKPDKNFFDIVKDIFDKDNAKAIAKNEELLNRLGIYLSGRKRGRLTSSVDV